MFEQVDTFTWIVVIVVGVVSHVALVVSGRWFNLMAVLSAAFIVLSLMAACQDLGRLDLLRLARTYCAILAVGVGLLHLRLYRFRPASMVYLVFVAFYVLAGSWSHEPTMAIFRKGIYAVPMVVGVMFAYSLRDRADIKMSMRVLGVAAIILAVFLLVPFAREFGLVQRAGPWGLNPNRLGAAAAAMLMICTYVTLYDSMKILKVATFGAAIAFSMMILYSGSRGAVAIGLVGVFVIAMPLMRRPVAAALLVLVIFGAYWTLQKVMVSTHATERLTDETSLTGRDVLWANALDEFGQSPLIGKGWAWAKSTGTGLTETENLHNIYIQALVEAGIIGLVLLILALILASGYSLASFRWLQRRRMFEPMLYFAGGMFGAAMAQGLVESNSLIGSNAQVLLLPFSIGLFERLPAILSAEDQTIEEQARLDAEYADLDYGDEPTDDLATA